MTKPLDAHILARLRAGHVLNGELGQVSDLNRVLARRMSRLPPEDRDQAWSDHLADLTMQEAEALIAAVAAADPDAPAPAPSSDDGEPWRPLRLGDLPPV